MSSPAVANGVVYFGSHDRFLYAVDAATGELRWRYETRGKVKSSPSVSNGTVYVGSWDKRMHAVDIETGLVKWTFETGRWVLGTRW